MVRPTRAVSILTGSTELAPSMVFSSSGQIVPETIPLPAEVAERYRAETDADGAFSLGGVPTGARVSGDVETAGFARLTLGRFVLVAAMQTTGVRFSHVDRAEAIAMAEGVGEVIAAAILAETSA